MINRVLLWRNRPPKILLHPHPKLKMVAKEVDFNTTSKKELTKILRKMGAALGSATYGDKLGIAATQIGIPLRIAIVEGVVCINPTWQPSKAPPTQSVEGCYSVPGQLYSVARAPYGWAKFYSIDGELRSFKLRDVNAIIYQHELDHLDGKCCVDVGTLVEQSKKVMAKYKVLEEFNLNGIIQKKDSIIELDNKMANLKSLAGKFEKYDPSKVAAAAPAPEVKKEEPKAPEAPAPAPVTTPAEPEKAPEAPAPLPETPQAPAAPAETATPAPTEPGAVPPEGQVPVSNEPVV